MTLETITIQSVSNPEVKMTVQVEKPKKKKSIKYKSSINPILVKWLGYKMTPIHERYGNPAPTLFFTRPLTNEERILEKVKQYCIKTQKELKAKIEKEKQYTK